MPRKVLIADEDMDWLRQNHDSLPFTLLASRVGCCVDTLKRILMREGLAEFEGAKYAVRRDHAEAKWTRPCMSCKCARPRPKNHYFCARCRRRAGYGDEQ
jgi:hypothetical protein